ncbi:MAG: chorismate synthase [Planctomycetaceae bacterium]|jgi:chorismate synthase|nr:chorismate synthase [Planctomycetaceae bacterium]MBT4724913.1 chorismate synthase [Planctomycetaceae bacterium]MBT4846578.1 chorismate synthase [Planctomycetaceae bacterium]MBT5123863.1 chorismate synthase [Planctomycetaceae bacterium]MBT7254114.1 chorismate synthase [Planctomycetaceae bacterium]
MLRYWTAGESHGKTLLAVVDGFPAGIEIDTDSIDYDLRMRQGGYGRGGRQQIETDKVELLTGVWKNVSMGSPVTLQVINRDYKLEKLKELERPRPGHGDLTGAVKFLGSIRNVLERSSARETAVRVAAGALAKQILAEFQIECIGFVDELGGQQIDRQAGDIQQWRTLREQSEVYSLNPEQDPKIKQLIDQAEEQGDTLGGILEVHVTGLPFGLGTHAQWDRKLDGRIAQAVMAVQAIKGVEIGLGFEAARRPGSQVHDPITYDADKKDTPSLGFQRPTNNAGGLEAGMTNGQSLVVRAAKKPISTLRQPLESINLDTKQADTASYERSDVCAVSAAAIIIENVVAFEVAVAFCEKFGNDSISEMKARYELFQQMAQQR